jgi:NSS family neurotransmitter:Na+ symporter
MSREKFASRRNVILAMAGSAIGLGNIWRFPYITGQYGGSAFILLYIFCCFFLSMPIFISESVIGRATHKDTFGAMEALAPGTKWKWMGLFTVATPLILISYYSVVGGWSIEYFIKSLEGCFTPAHADEVTAMFGEFTSSVWEPLICMAIFMVLCAAIIYHGVKKGIELFNKVTIPILFVLIVLIMIYSVNLPGSAPGVKYLLKPDFSKITMKAFGAALGQSFFSLSLGVGTILTYSSYVSKDENILVVSNGTALADMIFAILSGFAVMPAVFAAGLNPGEGPGLIFQTLPYIFSKMGTTMSVIVAVLFFFTVVIAALSSAISMMEVGVAYLVGERGFSRKSATVLVLLITLVIGTFCSLSFGPLGNVKILGRNIFGFCDFLCSDWLMTLGAMLFCIFVGWKMSKTVVRDELTNHGTFGFNCKVFPFVYFMIRYVTPIVISFIFLTTLFA